MKCTLQERFFTEDRVTFNEKQLLDNIDLCENIENKILFTELLNILRFKAGNNEKT